MVITALFISPGHNYFGRYGKLPGEHPMLEVDKISCIAGRGIQGDRFYDFKPDYKGQITFFELETYKNICSHFNLYGKSPSVFRRNVITLGADLNALIGVEFEVQGVRFAGTGESAPCEWMNLAFAPGAEEFLKGKGGLRAKILSSGTMRKDEPTPELSAQRAQ
jgi:MOSC domain-containing protein YiiM